MQREIIYDEVFDAQEHYRLVLDSMARPGKINILPDLQLNPPPGIHPAAVLAGFALLNADATFHVYGHGTSELTDYLQGNTAALPVEGNMADFVFLQRPPNAELLSGLKTGTLPYPEDSATIILGVDELAAPGSQEQAGGSEAGDVPARPIAAAGNASMPGLALTLRGPGIAGERTLLIDGLGVAFLEGLSAINGEFPLGIDLILTDPLHRIACIPRSSQLRWEII